MLAKKFRLTKKKEIEKLFKQGRSSFDDKLGIKMLANKQEYNRFVVVVSAKVSKKAVIRNKIKRRLSEIARLQYSHIRPGYDLFILALPKTIQHSYNDLDSSFVQHMRKLKAWL